MRYLSESFGDVFGIFVYFIIMFASYFLGKGAYTKDDRRLFVKSIKISKANIAVRYLSVICVSLITAFFIASLLYNPVDNHINFRILFKFFFILTPGFIIGVNHNLKEVFLKQNVASTLLIKSDPEPKTEPDDEDESDTPHYHYRSK
jgi:hypothetical protein